MKCWTQIPIRLLVGDYDVITQSVPRSAAVREVRCYTNSTAPVICLALFCGVLLLRLVKVLYKTVTTRRSLTMKQRPNLVISTLHRLLPRSTTISAPLQGHAAAWTLRAFVVMSSNGFAALQALSLWWSCVVCTSLQSCLCWRCKSHC